MARLAGTKETYKMRKPTLRFRVVRRSGTEPKQELEIAQDLPSEKIGDVILQDIEGPANDMLGVEWRVEMQFSKRT